MSAGCFHRPGRELRQTVLCRHCGVAVEPCACMDVTMRKVNDDCPACGGSGWVSIVRGKRAKFEECLEGL